MRMRLKKDSVQLAVDSARLTVRIVMLSLSKHLRKQAHALRQAQGDSLAHVSATKTALACSVSFPACPDFFVRKQSPRYVINIGDCLPAGKAGFVTPTRKAPASFLIMTMAGLLALSFLSSCNSKKNDMKGMNMNDSMQDNSAEYLNNLKIPADKQQIVSSLPAIHPVKKLIQEKISADGTIEYDTRQERNIAARYSGRIEKLYVKYMYQPVKQGELLMEVYSPEMVTEQQNLIFLLSDASPDQGLIAVSKRKLMLLGMTQEEIDEVVKTKQPLTRLAVYSPYEGHIHQASSMNGSLPVTGSNMDGLSLKEGMYVQKGQTVFNLLDPHMVWAVLKIYADDAQKMKVNQKVELTVEGTDKKLQAQIDFIEPFYQTESKTLSARVYLSNMQHALKVGMYVKATISADSIAGIWIPKSTMLDLGKRKIIFLKKENVFQPHEIKTGITSGDFIQVIEGLVTEDEIASDAQYIQDSESFITVK